MKTFEGKSSMKNTLYCLVVTLALLTLAACGGGGGGGNPPLAVVKTTAVLTINLTGTLPASTAITGAAFTLTLPANVTPSMTNIVVTNGVVTPSGTFLGGTQVSPVYTAATVSAPGTINMALINAVDAGITQVGVIATITLQLANRATPTAGDFGFTDVVVTNVLNGPIVGMGASVSNVTLQ
jgi:hypothetical protein